MNELEHIAELCRSFAADSDAAAVANSTMRDWYAGRAHMARSIESVIRGRMKRGDSCEYCQKAGGGCAVCL